MRRRRIWCELLGYDELMARPVLDALARRDIELLFAVTPSTVAGAAGVVRACRDAGVRVGVWPLLEPEHGRWGSELTAVEFVAFGDRLLDELARDGALADGLVIDLEPPFEVVARPSMRSLARLAFGRRPEGGAARLAGLARRARERGMSVTIAALPLILADGARASWQALLATPSDAIDADDVSVMVYTSLIEGYSRGLLGRRDATALLARCAAIAKGRKNAGISLGAVSGGSLGDEPTYRSVGELAEDVAIARAAGVDDLALFSLCGVLGRPPIEAWLDAFVDTAPAVALHDTLRARGIVAIAAAVARLPAHRRK